MKEIGTRDRFQQKQTHTINPMKFWLNQSMEKSVSDKVDIH